VPLYFIALDIEQTRAVSLSKGTIFGVAVGNVFFLSSQRHPKVDRPLIDYSTAVFMQGGEVATRLNACWSLRPSSCACACAFVCVCVCGASLRAQLMGVVLGVLLNLLLPEIVTILLSAVVLGFNAYKTLHKAVARYKDESKKMLAKSTSHTSPPTTSPTMLFATAPDSKGTAGTVVPVPQQELAPGQVGQVLVAVEPAGSAAARASKLLAADAKSFQLWAWCLPTPRPTQCTHSPLQSCTLLTVACALCVLQVPPVPDGHLLRPLQLATRQGLRPKLHQLCAGLLARVCRPLCLLWLHHCLGGAAKHAPRTEAA
jgi:hypothetical protein